MLIKVILMPLWCLLDLIITLLPATPFCTVSNLASILEVASYGVNIFGVAQFIKIIGVILFWHTAHLTWAIVEWIYKKIPGVD